MIYFILHMILMLLGGFALYYMGFHVKQHENTAS